MLMIVPWGANNGTSWADAYTDLKSTIDNNSVSGDEIRVAQGIYKPETGTNRTVSFELKNGVELYGGYAGYDAVNPDARNTELYETILCGDIGTVDDANDNSYHVVIGSGTDSTAVLDGFTITGGNANGSSPNDSGGGIYNDTGSPTITNCTFLNYGAEIVDREASASTVSYSCIQDGWSGVGNISSDPLFIDADGPDNIYGTDDDDLRLSPGSPCVDAGNNGAVPAGVTTDLDGLPRFVDEINAKDTGGGAAPIVDMGAYEWQALNNIIYVDCNAEGINNGSSWENAFNNLQDALGVLSDKICWTIEILVADGTYKPGTLRTDSFQLLNYVTLKGGYAGYGTVDPDARNTELYETILSGDIVGDNSYHVVIGSGTDSTAVLDGFTITGGNANGSYPNDNGGGMGNKYSDPTITNCTFSGNSAEYGGGMSNIRESSPIITNCTFSGNSAGDGGGGGMYNYNYSDPTITNCILWGNGTEIVDEDNSVSTVTYSCIEDGWSGAGSNNTSGDPLFVDADGPDNIYGTDDDNLRLSPGSPCVDAGNNGAVPAGVTTDLDGWDRIADGDGYITKVIDMGAYEFSWASLGDFDGQYDVDSNDLLIFTQAWLTESGDLLWDPNCNISMPADDIINFKDFAVLAENWQVFCSVPDWVISYWKFDEAGGDTAYDSIGDNDITLQDEAMWTIEGKSNGAISFNGSSDYAEATAANDFIPDSNSLTISMWINPEVTNDSQCFIGKHTSIGDNIFLFGFWENGYHVRIKGETHTAGTKEPGWQHLSVVINPTGPSACQVTLYKNGVVLFSEPFADVVGDMSGKPWVLGQEWDGNTAGDFFYGRIDDLRFYDRALSSEEVLQVYSEFAD
jgi:hypothetical protein